MDRPWTIPILPVGSCTFVFNTLVCKLLQVLLFASGPSGLKSFVFYCKIIFFDLFEVNLQSFYFKKNRNFLFEALYMNVATIVFKLKLRKFNK